MTALTAAAAASQIQERLGHSSITVTLDRYGHLLPALDERVAQGLEEAFLNSHADSVRTSGGPEVLQIAARDASHTPDLRGFLWR